MNEDRFWISEGLFLKECPSYESVDPFGNIKIWEPPQKLVKYVIGMDVSEGIGQDFTVAFVMRVDTREVVAQLRTNKIEASMEPIGKTLRSAICVIPWEDKP